MKRKPKEARSSLFDVVVLAASAGGHAAITTILRDLPEDFSIPIVVMQHLSPENTGTAEMYGQHLPFSVEWIKPDSVLKPGVMLVCPPKMFIELLPDGSFEFSPNERGAIEKPIDRFFESVASSFGERAVGVILTGMQNDGALGARQLHLSGGRVIVQSEATAEYPDMPRATIQAGAADLVVPLQDIGQVIDEMVDGMPHPQPRSELDAIRQVFGDDGQIAALAHKIDWAETELGPVREWSATLRSVIRLAMDSPNPVTLWLGERAIRIVNDASIPMLGSLFPSGFAKSFPETSPERYEIQRTTIAKALTGERVIQKACLFPIPGQDKPKDAWWDMSVTPIREPDGRIIGVYVAWQERTADVLAARRLQIINRLATVEVANNRQEALKGALAVLKEGAELSFAIAYLLDTPGKQALLAGATGVEEGRALAPRQLPIPSDDGWPLKQVLDEGKLVVVNIPPGQEQGEFEAAALYPLRDGAEGRVIGALVLGTNPRLPLNESYYEFLNLVGETISSKVSESHARQRESERTERLAELDRTKTEFFANVSHEFRTPLTLLLAPLEELLNRRDELPASLIGEVDVAVNNSRRLLRLVNSLLDFSQIDSRRQQANFELTDLCALTTDIASVFRSSIEAAGLRFRVACAPNLQPVWVDHDMWEKIVSNLISNAFKSTFEGEIAVELRALSLHAELVIRDTGTGIPAQEMPNIFKRFHRIHGARARTSEGSGIGLAIVDDLVKRLGGQLRARSTEGVGTEFTIWLPYKSARIKAELTAANGQHETREFASELAREASLWLQNTNQGPADVMQDLLGPPITNGETRQGRILVADDNPDLRDYLKRLLNPRWDVELASDGDSALQIAIDHQPDLILADVMMPGLDGFELLKRVREEPQLTHTPVVLLTARAGEEAAIQGLLAGADDYIAKPFSPREVVARIQAVFERSRAQAVLRRSEELQTFLVKLNDALRPLADPAAIMVTASRVLGEQLRVDRAFYAEADGDEWPVVNVTNDYEQNTQPKLTGRHPTAPLGSWILDTFNAGQRLVVRDLAADSRFDSSQRAAHAALNIHASVAVPLVKEGKFVALLVVQSTAPRDWTEHEIELVTETAERTWAAVERARAEEALRASEEKYRTLFDSIDDGFAIEELIYDDDGKLVDFTYQEINPAFIKHVGMDLKGKRRTELFTEKIDYLLEAYDRIVKTGEPLQFEHFMHNVRDQWFQVSVVRIGGQDSKRLGAIFRNITERKRIEQRQEFLLQLNEALRPLSDPVDIQRAAMRVVGEHLQVDCVLYNEIRDNGETIHIEDNYIRGDFPVHRFGAAMDVLRRGETLVIEDQTTTPLKTPLEREASTSLSVFASATVPLIKEGRWVANFGVLHGSRRKFSQDDIAILRETAERTWDAIERARAEKALRESEAKFRTVFETMIEACCIFEMIYDDLGKPVDWRILEANPSYEKQSGLKDVAGKLASEVMPGTEPYWIETFSRVVETGEAEQIEKWHQPTGRWIHSSTARVGGPGSRRLISVFYDITERKRAEMALYESRAQLARELENAKHLQKVSRLLIEAEDGQELYDQILDVAMAIMDADFASIQMLDAKRGELHLLAWRNFHPDSARFWQTVSAEDATSCGSALRHGERAIFPNVRTDETLQDSESQKYWALSGITAVQSTPLTTREGRLVGMISTHWREAHTPGEEELRLLDILARQAADFFERRTL